MSGSGLSPMMRHYLEIKDKYKDCVVFYRLGDFYEMFFDDALEVSQLLDLTLTGRDCGLEERAPMCGIPYHAADTYIAKLVALGKKSRHLRTAFRSERNEGNRRARRYPRGFVGYAHRERTARRKEKQLHRLLFQRKGKFRACLDGHHDGRVLHGGVRRR